MGSLDSENEMQEAEAPADDNAQEEDEELIDTITKNLKDARSHITDWRNDAMKCYDFFSSDQWEDDDIAKLQDEGRPVITFNRIVRTINAVTGLELQNRQEVSFTARGNDDEGVAEVLSAAAQWARDNCDAEDEESESFQDCLITGMGWTETMISYDTNLNGSIEINRIDPMDMLWDPNARKRNLDDRRWQARNKDYTLEEFEELWPDFTPQYGNFWPTEAEGRPHDATQAFLYQDDQSDTLQRNRTVSVVQYQYWEREWIYRVVSPDGKIQGFTEKKFEKIRPYIESKGLKHIKQPRKVYKQVFMNGTQILEKGNCPVEGFTFRCMSGLRNRNKNTWFGLVTLMIDPQMWANKWLSQILHIINTNAKGGILAEDGAVKNPGTLADEWAKPNSIVWLNPGALSGGKIQQREAPRYPDGIDRLLQYAMQNINDIPGVNLELLGVANRDQAGYLEAQRKEAGVTILASFFDALRRYRKEQGRVLAQYIKTYISDGRLVRIVGDDGAKFVPLLKDDMTFEYDIVIDDAPTSPHMKERVFGVLSQLLPTLLQAGIPVPPDILDYAPIPEALKEKWKAMLGDDTKQKLAMQKEAMTMQMAEADLALKKKQGGEVVSKAILNVANAVKAGSIAKHDDALTQAKMGMDQEAHSVRQEQASADIQRKDALMLSEQQRKDLALALDHQRDLQRIQSNNIEKQLEKGQV